MKVFSRILCPLDFDQNSLKALDVAAKLAVQNDADLYLLHVSPTVFVPLGGPAADKVMSEEPARREMEEIAGKHLQNVRYHIVITTGDAADKVGPVQAELNADLIVMGTHGRSAVPRFFLGSVAEHVLRAATCPVLTIR